MPRAQRYPKPGGYVLVARDVFSDDELLDDNAPYTRRLAWLWLIAHASYKPRTISWGSIHVKLDRGDILASLRTLGKQWRWTPNRVNRFLDLLVKTERLVEHIVTEAGTVYRIVKYDTYQSPQDTSATDSGTAVNTATVQRRHKKNAGKSTGTSKKNRPVPQGGTSPEHPLDLTVVVRSAMPAAPAAQKAPAEWKDTEWKQDYDFVALTQGEKGYPTRLGSQGWPDAYRGFKAARRAGTTLDAIAFAIAKYRAECFRENSRKEVKFGTERVKMASTFFSPRTLPEYLPDTGPVLSIVPSSAVAAILSSVPKAVDPDDVMGQWHAQHAAA
jgi:hypothetical protein